MLCYFAVYGRKIKPENSLTLCKIEFSYHFPLEPSRYFVSCDCQFAHFARHTKNAHNENSTLYALLFKTEYLKKRFPTQPYSH
ncbi:hypothetical protein HK13_09365 [Acetobacter indonesiensis]|nr:hypothetical protein HK13_09365 [Acetobacter indonesiensis]